MTLDSRRSQHLFLAIKPVRSQPSRRSSITAIRLQLPQTRSPITAIRLRSSVENGHFRISAIKRSSDQETSITRSQCDPRSTTVYVCNSVPANLTLWTSDLEHGENAAQARRDLVKEISGLFEKEWRVMEFRSPIMAAWETHTRYIPYPLVSSTSS